MRILPLLLIAVLTTTLAAQQSGRHFRRAERTPPTPAESTAVDASATTTPAPLPKLRSGRPWPRFHFGRLPRHNAPATTAGPVDASSSRTPASKRGFWRPRRG